MTQPTEPAQADMQSNTPVSGSPKPKPAVANSPSDTPPGASPKPKPNVAGRPSNAQIGGARLAPFDAYTRSGVVAGSTKATPEDRDMRSRPVAKTRMLNIFPGGTPKL
ncbi:hypothetical protein NY406_05195 [Chlorobaculum sp. MV4-Y]|uniref:hypothetical protein n=1 Tax=Chlorobaculum sp. MV4-Y TaxID=2976335 RepID=UPI0021AEAFA8|nr:hypothetical protein [Chlorobaculum sp. MV4-Y]UWX58659.1 hypothetical protein NY406_05195 [Chlorobaculum sp. MV4-Y]